MITRLRLDIAYDGAGFRGWADQGLTAHRTVQGDLELWLGRLLGCPVPLVCAGRTDAGVHARGQVAHCDVEADDPDVVAALLTRKLRRVLPPDLVVRAVTVAPAGFDARFSAIWRRYIYRIDDSLAPDPLLRATIARVRTPLDLDAVNAAGASLLGLHDFAAFCRRREGATTIRTLLECAATRVPDGPFGGVVEVQLRADAFCHSMVRSLVGALREVGSGRRRPDWPATLLERTARAGEVPVMPANGLVFEEVRYPADAELATRATESRARRDAPDCHCEGDA